MRLIKPSVEIISSTPDALKLIELAGRTCYKSEDKITEDSAEKFVAMILKRGHESVLEHAAASVRFVCDRGVGFELVRHRIASHSMESTRYVSYGGGEICFVIPPWVDVEVGPFNWPTSAATQDEASRWWLDAVIHSDSVYQRLLMEGWRPEQARSVLPNSLKTELVMTANLREWRLFFKLRTAKAAHPQMREVSIPLLRLMQVRFPGCFDDIEVAE